MIPKQPIFCLKLPWDAQEGTNNPNPCNFEGPWLFKSLQTLGSIGLNFVNSVMKSPISQTNSLNPLQLDDKTRQKKSLVSKIKMSPSEQGEAEQRTFGSAQASGKVATLIEFYSPRCRLCNYLVNFVSEVATRNSERLNIVMADAENGKWLQRRLLWQKQGS